MWLFTRHGFFSVVVKEWNGLNCVEVRARSRKHIESLVRDFLLHMDLIILSTPRADYPYRIRISRKVWKNLAKDLAADVNYPNFKDSIKGDPVYHALASGVWDIMTALEEPREPEPTLGPTKKKKKKKTAKKD